MCVLILIILLSIELAFAYIIFKEDIMAPGVIFPGVFLFASLNLLSMLNVWKADIHFNTVLIVTGGCFAFIMGAVVGSKKVTWHLKPLVPNYSANREMGSPVQWVFIALNLLILVYVARRIMTVVSLVGFQKNVLASFGTYSYITKFEDVDVSIGRIASNLYQLAQAETCFWGYLLVEHWYTNKKVPKLILLNYAITTICYFLCGSRTGAVFSVIGLLPLFVITYRKSTGRKHLKYKYLFMLISIVGILMFSFQWMGEIIDRRLDGINLWEYLSIYIGAPILNLDMFLQESHVAPPIWGFNTFAVQINYVGKKLGWESYHFDIPFRSANGHNLGNVYTTFYSYLYDFGIVGMLILVFIMGYSIQLLYKWAKKDILNRRGITLAVLAFEFLFPCIVFSFFSNKFYEQLNIAFVKGLVYWMLLPRILFWGRRLPAEKSNVNLV